MKTGYLFEWESPLGSKDRLGGLDLDRLRALRAMSLASARRITFLESCAGASDEEVEQERAFLDRTCREIAALERRLLYSQFGFV